MSTTLINPVRRIVELLVARDYEQIVKITNARRLNAKSLEGAIRGYGRDLIMPPAQAFDRLDVVRVKNATPPRWSVRLNLWTLEEGRSNLSLELTVVQWGDDYGIEVDDIHVL